MRVFVVFSDQMAAPRSKDQRDRKLTGYAYIRVDLVYTFRFGACNTLLCRTEDDLANREHLARDI